VLEDLHPSIGFRLFHLRRVPRLSTDDLSHKRKEYAIAMLPFLHAAERDGWHHFVIDDESWFFFEISPRRMETASRDNAITKPAFHIQSKQIKFIIVWNPSGFYAVDRLLNDTKMNSDYFLTNIHIPLEQTIIL
jgi:hypothetical protein